mmetsp:Transcript_23144/g.49198  ORF Transcript_23144/g.49198 Transcript_23144/m.49198 type:complete len:223 (-) Transcript_23144:137-805(-)
MVQLECEFIRLRLRPRALAITEWAGARQRQPRRLPLLREADLRTVHVERGRHVGDVRGPHDRADRPRERVDPSHPRDQPQRAAQVEAPVEAERRHHRGRAARPHPRAHDEQLPALEVQQGPAAQRVPQPPRLERVVPPRRELRLEEGENDGARRERLVDQLLPHPQLAAERVGGGVVGAGLQYEEEEDHARRGDQRAQEEERQQPLRALRGGDGRQQRRGEL